MENALTLTKSPHADSLAVATRQAHKFISQAKARNTVRAYRSDWSHFETWCHQHGVASLPADVETVASYLSDLAATSRVSTLQRRVAAISVAHKMAGHGSPTSSAAVRALLAGIRRSLGTKPGAKKPALTDDIRAMLDCLPDSLLGARDRALLLLGFAGAFRRSELVGLDVQDLEFTDDGLVITLRRSKTDQEGETRKVGIPFGSGPTTCPVRALRSWLDQTANQRRARIPFRHPPRQAATRTAYGPKRCLGDQKVCPVDWQGSRCFRRPQSAGRACHPSSRQWCQ